MPKKQNHKELYQVGSTSKNSEVPDFFSSFSKIEVYLPTNPHFWVENYLPKQLKSYFSQADHQSRCFIRYLRTVEHKPCCCQSSSGRNYRNVKLSPQVKYLLSEVHISVALRVYAPRWGRVLHFSAWLSSRTHGKQHMPRCQKFEGCVWAAYGGLIHLRWFYFLFLSSQECKADLIHTYFKSLPIALCAACTGRPFKLSIWRYHFSKNHRRIQN